LLLANDDHDRLVAKIYESALGEAAWGPTLLQFAGAFGASASVFHVYDATSRVLHSENHGYSREFADAFYASDAYAKDPRVPHFVSVPDGGVYYDRMLYDVEAMNRDRWCRQSVDILQVKYQLGAMIGLPDGGRAGIAILTTEQEGHATDAAVASLSRLAPHFEQACALGHLVEQRTLTRTALLEALSLKLEGVLLLNRAGSPTFVNDAATAIFNADDGLAYAKGALQTRRAAETRKLQAMIGSAIAQSAGEGEFGGGRMLVTRLSARRPYVIRVLPVPRTERFLTTTSIACVVHVQDLARTPAPPIEALRLTFGLTRREAELAVELARCAALEGAAANAGMAINTARNHLQKVFQKTETRSQVEAVQLLSRIV